MNLANEMAMIAARLPGLGFVRLAAEPDAFEPEVSDTVLDAGMVEPSAWMGRGSAAYEAVALALAAAGILND